MKKILLFVAFAVFGATGIMAQNQIEEAKVVTEAKEMKKCSKKDAKCCSKDAKKDAKCAKEAKKCAKKGDSKCCSKKAKAATTSVSANNTQVLSAAMKKQNITKRECAESGKVSYFKKEVCEKSGKVSYQEVQFDEKSSQFVNVSPNDIGNADDAEVYKMTNTEKVADAAETTAKKSCSKKGDSKCCSKKKKAEGTNN